MNHTTTFKLTRASQTVPCLALCIALAGWLAAGCTTNVSGGGGGGGELEAEIMFDGDLAEFQVEPDVPAESSGLVQLSFDDPDATVGSGNIQLDPALIEFAPANGAEKQLVAAQTDGAVDVQVTVRISSSDEEFTVCQSENADQYGPYTVTLDENFVPVAISPEEIDLTPNTLSLINSREFSICIRIESPVGGTVRVNGLRFRLRPGTQTIMCTGSPDDPIDCQ